MILGNGVNVYYNLFNKNPKVIGIIVGLFSFIILEIFSIFAIAIIGNNFQAWLWFKQFPYPLFIWFIIIPFISSILGLCIIKRIKSIIIILSLIYIGIIIYILYYLIKVLTMEYPLPKFIPFG